jgi:exodeoxyribonuclease V gamma subunit
MLSDITSSGEGDVDAFVEIAPDSLLHNIQLDILDLENRAVMGVTAKVRTQRQQAQAGS